MSYPVPGHVLMCQFCFFPPDTWVVINASINILGNLVLEGTLEFANNPGADYELSAYNIIIMGGRLIIGWPDDPFLGMASLILRGNHSSPYFIPAGSGPTVGSKAIGKVYVTYSTVTLFSVSVILS